MADNDNGPSEMTASDIQPPGSQPTVFVVDDDPSAGESVRVLVDPMDVATELFCSAEEFLEAFNPDSPGCLVVDLRMLKMSGVELLEVLRNRGIDIPTIVMSAHADVPVTVKAMQLGAVTLLEKPCRDTELWDAIRAALQQDVEQRKLSSHRQTVQQRLDALTDLEREVLELMAQGTANKVIANRLDVSLRTVEARRHNVFRKMKATTVAELVRSIVQAGIELPTHQ